MYENHCEKRFKKWMWSDLRSNEHYLSSSENTGLYGIWTHDLCDSGACSALPTEPNIM